MTKKPLSLALLLALCVASSAWAADAPPVKKPESRPKWDMARLSQTPAVYPAEGLKAEGVRAVFYEGLPYRGQPTRVFAWIGIPKTEPGKRVPGMVLVHGGGGTAFDSWVRLWNQRGYAAIAMDTCGSTPGGERGKRPRHEHSGPPGWGGWNQIDEPGTDQWTYHAVGAAILAHSLLRTQPEVDPERIGLTGISWGGYLTCIISGVDARFKFAAPVYGCGFTNEHGFTKNVESLGAEQSAKWMQWWDPKQYLPGAKMPMLWVNGSNDFAYTLNAYQKSYRAAGGPRTLCIRLRMPHGHGPAGEGPKEIHAFADSILCGGTPLGKILEQGVDGNRVWVKYESPRPIVKTELNVTTDLGPWQKRLWKALPAKLDGKGEALGLLPELVTVFYMNLFDDRDCAISTEHIELMRE